MYRTPVAPAGLVLVLGLLPASLHAQAGKPLTLGDAARVAATNGPTTAAAREHAISAGARVYQARAELLPSLSSQAIVDGGSEQVGTFGSSVGGPTPLASNRDVDFRFQASQKLFDLAAIRRVRTSAMEADATASSARDASEVAAQTGALAYLRVLRADARLTARLADSTLSAELLDIARQQLAAGTAIALDVTRAESQLASNVSDLIGARSELAQARLELSHALALPMGGNLVLADSLRAPAPADAMVTEAEAVRTALTHRGDVLAAESWSEAARRDVGAIRAERLPTVSLFSTIASNQTGAFDAHTYGIQVSFSLFDGFRRESRIAEARAHERETSAQWEDLRRQVEVEVRSALLDLSAAKERVGATGVQLRLAEQEVAQARERFAAGLDDNSDVIAASLSLNGARDRSVDALASYHAARVALASAQGVTTAMD